MNKSDIIEFIILGSGVLIIEFSFFFYILQRKSPSSFAFIAIVITCLSLIYMTFSPKTITKIIFGIEINKMSLTTAQHYQTMIFNFIALFSAFIGIGITLVWSSKGEIWKTYNFWFLMILFGLFYTCYIFCFFY